MPAKIVIVKHKKRLQTKQQNFNINLCAPLLRSGVDVDAAAIRNTSNAADVDVETTTPPDTPTAWRRRRMRQPRSAKAASTLRTVIIIMALVFSIMQQQQPQQQQQQQQQQVLQWPFCYGKCVLFMLCKHTLSISLSLSLRPLIQLFSLVVRSVIKICVAYFFVAAAIIFQSNANYVKSRRAIVRKVSF